MDKSGVVYAREFDGKSVNFGVVGVDKGTLIMYDEETRSRWNQLFGEAVSGPMAGKKLAKIPSTLTTWARWKQMHPETTVYVKPSTEYKVRFSAETFAKMGQKKEDEDDKIGPHDVVIGVEGHVQAIAYPLYRLATERLVHDTLESTAILVYLGDDLASARVLDRTVDGRGLTLERLEDGRLRDSETSSTWDPMTGAAVDGPLKGRRMESLISTPSVWFAWQKYRPDTRVYGEGP